MVQHDNWMIAAAGGVFLLHAVSLFHLALGRKSSLLSDERFASQVRRWPQLFKAIAIAEVAMAALLLVLLYYRVA